MENNTELLAQLSDRDIREKDLLTWLYNAGKGILAEMGKIVKLHPTTISRLFAGTYSGNVETLLDKIESTKRRMERILCGEFIENEVTRAVFDVLDRARDFGTMALIQGASRRGKTYAVREWIARNEGGVFKAVYIDCPSEKSMRGLVREIAKALGLPAHQSVRVLREQIEDKVTSKHVLIFDEATRLMKLSDPTDGVEFIRRLHDTAECGVCFVATDWFSAHIESGKYAIFFEQLIGRLEDRVVIPRKVSLAEIKRHLAPYVAGTPSKDLLQNARKVVEKPGKIAELSRHLNDAMLLAKSEGRARISADDFEAAMIAREGAITFTE